MKICNPHALHRALALLLAFVLCFGLASTAFAAQEDSYHDPAEYWLSASNRTNELDANAIVTSETFYCAECNAYRAFTVWRTPEYTRDGATALSRNVMYSDGTTVDGENTGSILDGVPGVNAWYTGYHWTKASCQTCGTINGNMGVNDYGHGKNVYWLYDCAAEFMVELEETVAYEYVSDLYHEVTVTGGSYCGFCYGTYHTEETELEHHDMEYTVTAEPGNLRFVRTGTCADCGYATTEYVTAKAVIQSYLGTVDGDAHTIVVSDLSDSGVSVSIRYGLTADSCTMTAAPTYDEAGTNYIYYAITYTYKGESMTENGVTYVTLVEAAAAGSNSACACGCGDTDCGCKETSCSGNCCGTCSNCDHSNSYSYTIDATCTALGYTKYICLDCGTEWSSDYISATGHLYQYFTTSEATCETAGKTIGICVHCGLVTTETTEKADHQYSTYTVSATCTSPGYTVHECSVCGDRYISDITAILSHSYTAVTTAATCTTAGKTVYFCTDCGSSYAGSYIAAYGHDYVATEITAASCNGAGVTQYKCADCGDTYLVAQDATGHTPGEAATCTEGQYCLDCGAIIALPTGHDYTAYVTEATCTDGGYTTHICANCGDSYVDSYTDAHGHDYVATEITAASCNGAGVTQYKCADCGDTYLVAQDATGHTLSAEATCTKGQYCLDCGAIIVLPTGHDYTAYVTVATCTEGGYTTHICANCGDSYVDGYTDAHGHDYVATEITAASCNGAGVTQYKCVDCGDTYLVAQDATGHTPGEAATCMEGQYCLDCGAIIAVPTGHDFVAEVVAATCNTMGYTVYTCSHCGQNYKSNYTEATGHGYELKVTEPTCTEGGYTTHICVGCGKSYVGNYTDAHGHDYVATEITAASCNGAGVTQYKCADCGDTYLVAQDATGHTPGEAATCTEEQYCLDCGAIIALPTGHDYTAYVTEATCTDGGYTTHICANCGDSYVDGYTDARGHDYVATEITAASCNGAGVTQYKCADCGDTYLVAQDATGHTPGEAATCTEGQYCLDCGAIIALPTGHDYTMYVTTATCTEDGYTTHICANCGDSYVADYTDAHGHTFVAESITLPTCNGAGVTQYTCVDCGEHYLEAESATGHTPGEAATCTAPQFCIECGAVIENALGHDYVAEIVDATCTTMGYTVYTCSRCGESHKSDYTEATGHSYEAVVTEPTCLEGGYTTCTCANCGDSYVADHIDAHGHTFVAESITLPTCNGAGVTQYTCADCGEHYLEAESATGHNINGAATCTEVSCCLDCGAILALPTGHNYEAVVTEPTCLEGGYTTCTCANCGDSYVTDYTDALDHAWDEGRIVTDSVCGSEGVIEYRCERCGYHRLEAVSIKGHTPGNEATCTTAQLCTVCGAILAEPIGHSYEAAVTGPTCTELGYTTYTCTSCGDSYDTDYVNAVGHTAGGWIVDVEPTTSSEGSRHRECVDCGEVLETERIDRIYLFGYTDVYGETVIGDYLVTVTDTSSANPVPNAAVTLGADGTLCVVLPDGRLIDYAAQTTVTVQMLADGTPVPNVGIVVTDEKDNYSSGETDEAGKLTVPFTSGVTNADGRVTVGGTDANGSLITLTVKVEDFESARPIEGALVTVTNGVLDILLPDGTDMDEGNRILVTVLDNAQAPVRALDVAVRNDLGRQEQGQTNRDGKLIVPALSSAYTDENGTVILGKYTVIVTDSVDKPVSGALVTLIESGDGDSFTVLLPSGRLLDANDQTTVTVLLPSADPAVGLSVTVSDGNGNHAAKVTNSAGQVVVPNKTASGGETVGKTDSTYNVEVTDSSGDPIDGADTSIGEDGTVTVVLPGDVTLDEEDPVTVTVTDNDGNPVEDVPVTVTDSEGSTARGETDATGSVTVPSATHVAYIYGYADGTVRPNVGMTRAEAAAVFARILAEARGDVPGGYSTSSYDDVSTDSWYYEYVAYLDTLGIVVGYGDGSFGPDDTITRYEFVTICVRLSSLMAMQDGSDTVSNFSDVSGGHWAYSYVKTAAVHGWIIGYTDSLFRGDNDISRAEVVTIVNRFTGRSADEDYVDANLDSLNTFTDLWNPHIWYYYDMMEAANSHSIVTGASAETWCD